VLTTSFVGVDSFDKSSIFLFSHFPLNASFSRGQTNWECQQRIQLQQQ